MKLFDRWKKRCRQALIARIRPGRDEEELLEVLRRAEAIQSDEHREMLEELIDFPDTRVREVMVPRSDIQAVAVDTSLDEVERIMVQSGVSRLPVIENDLDHVLGVVHAWDILAARVQGKSPNLSQILRRCLRVSELEHVFGLLSEMKREACHIAIVHDEYGGTAGLVTLSDLLSEIVGSMDELEAAPESEACARQEDGSWIMMGKTRLEELEESTGVSLPHGDYDTVAGLITTHLGRIPKNGEECRISHLRFRIIKADPRRILKVRVVLDAD